VLTCDGANSDHCGNRGEWPRANNKITGFGVCLNSEVGNHLQLEMPEFVTGVITSAIIFYGANPRFVIVETSADGESWTTQGIVNEAGLLSEQGIAADGITRSNSAWQSTAVLGFKYVRARVTAVSDGVMGADCLHLDVC